MDKKDNQILKLTFEFSIQVVLYCELLEEKRKYIVHILKLRFLLLLIY